MPQDGPSLPEDLSRMLPITYNEHGMGEVGEVGEAASPASPAKVQKVPTKREGWVRGSITQCDYTFFYVDK